MTLLLGKSPVGRWAVLGYVLVFGFPNCWTVAGQAADASWPMLAHDAAQRRDGGGNPAAVCRKWYRLFPDEGLMTGVQPVVADGCVYVGTLAGVVHAIDAETGQDRWTFRAPGAVLHSCAADGGKVFFGCADGRIYALRCADGTLAWTVPTGAAVWNAPAVHAGMVFVGSRDGCLYAIQAEDGKVRWTAATGGPLLCSPAVDAKAGRVYVGSEDMHVYAFALDDGHRVWRSEKLPGVSHARLSSGCRSGRGGARHGHPGRLAGPDGFGPAGDGQRGVRRLCQLAALEGRKRSPARGQFRVDEEARHLSATTGIPAPPAAGGARAADVFRPRPGHRQAAVRDADRVFGEHERHRSAGGRRRRTAE